MEEPSQASQRPMSQGGLSEWLNSRPSKTTLDDTDKISETPEISNPELLKYKKTHIDYYVVLQGDKPPEIDKYELFHKWTAENGVIWPKVEWPVWIDNEYLGARVPKTPKPPYHEYSNLYFITAVTIDRPMEERRVGL